MTDYASLFTGKTGAPQAPATHLTPPKYRLLLVDDELGIVKALTRVFRQENYEVITAGSGKEALEKLAQGPVHLVISDFMMPGMNGAQFLHEVKLRSPETIRIMLTGHANTDAVMGAINDGAVYKFILKPWNDDDLRVTVALALEQFDLIARNKVLKTENAQKTKEISALQAGAHPPQPARHHAAQEKPALLRPVAGTKHAAGAPQGAADRAVAGKRLGE